ncbi:hypothetical protein F1D05_09930 [Kribbella qitaiheensis]|uniref:Uncharacterized protein n=1 Tax=Kribbella qitaiheensis TaxID=1544730 RepID=A0A7G6WVY6_9ACTN|nr:hypothetical protein [Kribbella qitaiheensis]QNE18151.1 hypothetical protein F1D05_09930 [Kribbella qitaiheensis]
MASTIASARAGRRVSVALVQATAATCHDDLVSLALRRPGWLDHEARLRHRTHRITAHWVGVATTPSTGQNLAVLRNAVHPTLMLTSVPLTWLISIDDATSQDRVAVDAQGAHGTEPAE